MSDGEKQVSVSENENHLEYASETDGEEQQQVVPSNPKGQGQRTMHRARQKRRTNEIPPEFGATANQQGVVPVQDERITGNMAGRTGAIRESRIKDRPVPQKETRDSSLKIKIELDLEVEVDLYARVKGDVTIGLL